MKGAIALLSILVLTSPVQAQTFTSPNTIQSFAQTYCTLRRGGMSDKKAAGIAFNNMGMDFSEMLGNLMFSRKKMKEVLKTAVIGTCPEVVGYPTYQPATAERSRSSSGTDDSAR